jgi:frataxin-like iron-binding protein CyaY
MKKQALKAVTMLMVIITLAFASALASSAQTRSLVVNIPFEFSVGNKTLPAGEYIVNYASQASREGLTIQKNDGSANAISMTMNVTSREPQKQARLVFNKYGDRHFLSQIWMASRTSGRELNKSRSERALETELAKSDVKAETVILVARNQ